MQRRGDDWSGAGQYEFYRWWTIVAFELGDGSALLSGAVANPSDWHSVMGQAGDASPEAQAGFAAAVTDMDRVGLTFGGRFYAHGVALAPGCTGTATFFVDEFNAA